ncbi:MAG: ABC transporter permease [Candidatus Schekmanbacteria bacterium]|nr:ABC transporter permease [Candidatus Schekmanbacteria bacterium]
MALVQLSPITKKRLARFRSHRRGYWSLWILCVVYLMSLGAELLIGSRAVFVAYQGHWYFPALTNRYYAETLFGGELDLEADFRLLVADAKFKAAGGTIVMPPHPYSPLETVVIEGDRPPAAPTWGHPLGTDDRGRDILARLVYGFRISMTFAIGLTAVAIAVGCVLGAIQGFFGGRVDLTMQRLTEIWAALPFLYVVILISSILTPNFWLLLCILLLFQWIGVSRYIRAEFLRERNLEYVSAARALGIPTPRIMLLHITPNALTPVVTLAPFLVVSAIFSLASLDFLGFGLPAPTPSWGELFKQGQGQITAWWLTLSPFFALFTTLLLTTFVGEAIRDAWDPKAATYAGPK